jgi:hypothetical protein
MLRSLVDPHAAPLRAEPREPRDLIAGAHAGWILALDNVSHIRPWLSDGLCRLATGGGYVARALYTDLDEVVVDVQRPVLMTGIVSLATRSDLADRAIVITLPPLDDADRRPEAELTAAFDAVRPRVLGALLTGLSCGLRDLPNTHLDSLPRMADYATWLAACEPRLGLPRGTLVGAYTGARREVVETTLDASPVAMALRAHMATWGTWEGTACGLQEALGTLVSEEVRPDRRRWPQSPRGLSGTLRRLAPMLRAAGIVVDLDQRATDRQRTRTVRVSTVQTVRAPDPTNVSADGRRTDADGTPCGPSAPTPFAVAGLDGADGVNPFLKPSRVTSCSPWPKPPAGRGCRYVRAPRSHGAKTPGASSSRRHRAPT